MDTERHATALLAQPFPSALLFYGPPGSGKSTLARRIAATLGRESVTIPCHAGTDFGELISAQELENNDGATVTRRVAGPIASALIDGRIVILDDIDRAHPRALPALFEALEPGSRAIHVHGRKEARHAAGAIIGTANTRLDGADPSFVASAQDEAIRDRFPVLFEFDHPTESAIAEWLAARAPTLAAAQVATLAKIGHDAIRAKSATTRRILALGEALAAGINPKDAVALVMPKDDASTFAATLAAYEASEAGR